MNSERLRIVLSGMVAGDPHQGGATWAVLQYALGLRRLGHDVLLVEPVKPAAATADSPRATYFRRIVADSGFAGRAALLAAGTRATIGLPYEDIAAFARRAD